MLFVSYINSARPTKMKKNVNKLIRTDKRIDVSVLFLVLLLAKITIFGMNSMLEAENAVLAHQCLLIVATSLKWKHLLTV